MLNRILEWDRETFIYLNSLGIEDYDGFWSVATNISSWIPLFVLFFILILLKYPLKEAVLMSLSVVALAFCWQRILQRNSSQGSGQITTRR